MLSNQEYKFLNKLINKLNVKEKVIEGYPLLENAFTKEYILSGIEVLLSRQLTMSEITYKFEKYFAKFIGSKYALMVNSGS